MCQSTSIVQIQRFHPTILFAAAALLAAAPALPVCSGHNPSAFGSHGRQRWDQNAAAETQPKTGTGHFKTQTDRARDAMREAQGYVNYEYRSASAET